MNSSRNLQESIKDINPFNAIDTKRSYGENSPVFNRSRFKKSLEFNTRLRKSDTGLTNAINNLNLSMDRLINSPGKLSQTVQPSVVSRGYQPFQFTHNGGTTNRSIKTQENLQNEFEFGINQIDKYFQYLLPAISAARFTMDSIDLEDSVKNVKFEIEKNFDLKTLIKKIHCKFYNWIYFAL